MKDISDITYEQGLEKRIEVLQHEVDMWRKHVVELEAELAGVKLSNKGMHKTIERMTESVKLCKD